MYEHMMRTLPESALACRSLYDPQTGGYHLPVRSENQPIRLADVDRVRQANPEVQFDCVEAPVADLLYSLVVNTHSRLILETGTSRGFSTSHLAAAACVEGLAGGRVITVDPAPTPHPFFEGTPLAASITTVRADALSLDFGQLLDGDAFDFMFFDSLHTYGHLSAELSCHLPWLRVGGLFALHDTMVYDDLGLVVLAMMASRQVEALSLPTHRRHQGRMRPPGVSLFRKIAPIAPGELVFPDLSGVVEGERQCLERPEDVVQRTGALFTDPRYASGGLRRAGKRTEASAALLDPSASEPSAGEGPARTAMPTAGPLPRLSADRVDAFVARASMPSAAAQPSPAPAPAALTSRLQSATPSLLDRQARWWQVHGESEARYADPRTTRIRPLSQQRIEDRLARLVQGCEPVLHVRCGGPAPKAGPKAIHMDLRGNGAAERFPPAAAYVFHMALHHWPANEITALLQRLAREAPAGAPIVLLEPTCYPQHRPDPKDLAWCRTVDETVLRPARRAVDELGPTPGIETARGLLATRWWGELPRGPAPMQQPFIHDELPQLVGAHFSLEACDAVQSTREASALCCDLTLLAEHDSNAANRWAADLLPRFDALESVLLGFPRLPDTSWFTTLVVARQKS